MPRTPVDGVGGWVGAANSIVTLLVAGAVAVFAAVTILRRGKFSGKLWGLALVLVGGFFAVNSLVALFVPAYAWFWYLTDFWMLTLPILGAALLLQQKSSQI